MAPLGDAMTRPGFRAGFFVLPGGKVPGRFGPREASHRPILARVDTLRLAAGEARSAWP